jgi:hypothetical protein
MKNSAPRTCELFFLSNIPDDEGAAAKTAYQAWFSG